MMKLNNTSTDYGLVAITVHWIFALIVFGLFGLGLYMVELTYYDPNYKAAPNLHRSIGVLLGFLLLFRVIWKIVNPSPQPEPGAKTWEIKASHVVHGILYLLPMLLIVSGYLISTADGRPVSVFGWFDIPALLESSKGRETTAGQIHQWLAYSLIALIGLHAGAALKHHFINRDRTLLRMLGGCGSTTFNDPGS